MQVLIISAEIVTNSSDPQPTTPLLITVLVPHCLCVLWAYIGGGGCLAYLQ